MSTGDKLEIQYMYLIGIQEHMLKKMQRTQYGLHMICYTILSDCITLIQMLKNM